MTGDVASDYVMTVRGPIAPERLGTTMTHEHIYCDLAAWRLPPRTALQHRHRDDQVGIGLLGEIRRDALVFADNLRLDDEAVARRELIDMREAGVSTIVELSVNGLHGQPARLVSLSSEVDLNIVVGCGYYIQPSHPPSLAERSVDDLTAELLTEIRSGLGDTRIRPGVIGEIGTGQPVHTDEWKVLEAACAAQLESGLALYVHVYPMSDGATAPEVAERVLARGVDPRKLNICHMDGRLDFDYHRAVLETGVYISFDTFGQEAYYDGIERRSSFDAERERALMRLLESGYEHQLLISQDNCLKMHLSHYGGYGYSHVLRHIVPSLRRHGVSKETLNVLLVENPRRLLSVSEKPT